MWTRLNALLPARSKSGFLEGSGKLSKITTIDGVVQVTCVS